MTSRGPGSRALGCRGTNGEVGDPTPLNRCVIRRFPLRWIIAFAHDIPVSRIDLDVTGGPAWIDSDLYDIDAKAEADATTAELKAMLRTLLADRFHLKTRIVEKTGKGFTVTVLPTGARLDPARNPQGPMTSFTERTGVLTIKNGPIAELVATLSAIVEAPVVDQTGLSGSYDISLKWTPENFGFVRHGVASDSVGATIFTALQEQLGLPLESKNDISVTALVVESAAKPDPFR